LFASDASEDRNADFRFAYLAKLDLLRTRSHGHIETSVINKKHSLSNLYQPHLAQDLLPILLSVSTLVMPGVQFTQPDHIRQIFCSKLSEMYHSEVPLYGALVSLVDDTNAHIVATQPQYRSEAGRLRVERHGAIRVGKPEELHTLRRLFRTMNMLPVNYYDLSIAGVPVHATAFRPVTQHSLDFNPFRVFTSLLRPELIEDVEIRELARSLMDKREIFHPETLRLLDKAESQGGLDDSDAHCLVDHALLTFKWQSDALVEYDVYNRLATAHSLVADIAAFKGPHINHLTPRTLDIDTVQARMPEKG
jgi:uncharacterized glyoxalase superfamily metalloenzyme YdcJ